MSHSHAHTPNSHDHHPSWVLAGLVVAVLLAVIPSPFKNAGTPNQDHTQKATILEMTDSSVTIQGEQGEETLAWSAEDQAHLELEKGDSVLVTHSGEFTQISDHWRVPALSLFFGIFIFITLWISRWQGLRSLLALVISFQILFKWTFPWIVFESASPLLVTGIALAVLTPITFYLSHGFRWKTHVALSGTLITLVMVLLMAHWALKWAQITGNAPEELYYLSQPLTALHTFQLVQAAIWVSILGVMDDVTVAQTSTVLELFKISREKNSLLLFKHAMEVGRDHIASVLNTLFLIWAGSSLPMLLVWIDKSESLWLTLNYEFMAEEILQTLITSTGLILAVPIVTAIAAFLAPSYKE